jgi:hypothetical protein
MSRPYLRLLAAVLLGLNTTAQAQRPTGDEAARAPVPRDSTPAAAADAKRAAFSTWVGYAQSDNVARVEDAERGSYADAGVMFDAAHSSPRVTGNIVSNVEFRKYGGQAFDDETLGRLDGDADFNVAKDVFHWRFRETFDQGRTDASATLSPGNREDVNVVSSGPQLDLPIGQRVNFTLGGTYSYRRYQESQYVDNDAVIYDLGVLRQMSETAQVGILASTNDVDFADDTIAPYKIDALNLRYTKMLATGAVLAELGKNKIHLDGPGFDKPAIGFQWYRDVSARGTLSINAERRFTDSGGLATATRSDAPSLPQADVLLSTSPLDRKSVGVGYLIAAPRMEISIGAARSKDSYFGDTTLDNRTTITSFRLSRTVSMRLRFGVSFYDLSRDFEGSTLAGVDDRERTTSAWVNRSLGRRLSVSLALTRYQGLGFQSFDENRYEVRFGYSPTSSGDAALPFVGR